MVTKHTRFLNRRKTGAQWTVSNEILLDGEIGVVTDVSPRLFKVGDGVTSWNNLPFAGVDPSTLEGAKNRSNHSGTQLASTISDFAASALAAVVTGLSSVAGAPVATDNVVTILSKFKNFYDNIGVTVRGTLISGVSFTVNSTISATDSILSALGKLQSQINNKATAADIITGTDNVRLLTAKAINEALLAPIKETVISTGGTLNDLYVTTEFIRFTNQTVPVILTGIGNPVDGKRVVIVNNTMQNIDILHQSVSSGATNRLINNNNQNLFIVVGGSAQYVYSGSLQRWVLNNIWATDYFASLIGTNKRAVEVTAEGFAVANEIKELKMWRDGQITTMSKSDLNSGYPSATKGQQVVCQNVAGGGRVYEKYDDNTNDWFVYNVTIVS